MRPFARLSSAVAFGTALCSLSWVPAAKEDAAPRVDVRKIAWNDGVATAPIVGGAGHAELTLDSKLQRTAHRLLARARPIAGAAVAVDVATGRVLVWAERGKSGLLTKTSAPAASVFKIVTSVALFERAGISPKHEVCTQGGNHGLARRHLDPPRRGKALCAPFSQALGYSRNAAYAQLATQKLLRSDLVATVDQLGFTGRVPFDLPATVGSSDIPYNDLEFARAAAGFRGSRLSPVGGAHLATTIANGGRPARLHLVRKAEGYAAPKSRRLLARVMKPSTAHRLTRMMEVTVHSGTALDTFQDRHENDYLPGVRVAGKTGTLRPSRSEPTTTWFVGFAPSRRPRIVVSVLVQNGPVWRRLAKDVARDLLRAHFAGRVGRVTHPFSGG